MSDLAHVLAVFGHPDDESLAAGGLLARQAAAGAHVTVLCATWAPGTGRAAELVDAARALGVEDVRLLGYGEARVGWSAPVRDRARGAGRRHRDPAGRRAGATARHRVARAAVTGRAVVVVDVLRAFTTAPWVLERGAASLTLSATREEALATKALLGDDAIAITDGELTHGFDLGNSPGQVSRADLAGRHVVQVTANGTVGVQAARGTDLILCAGLVTAAATATYLRASGLDDVTYVVTGGGGQAPEDVACAEHVRALVEGREPPADTVERTRTSPAAAGLARGAAEGWPGVAADDVDLSCELGRFAFAVVVHEQDGTIRVTRR